MHTAELNVVIITSNLVILCFVLQRTARAARLFLPYSSNQILNSWRFRRVPAVDAKACRDPTYIYLRYLINKKYKTMR